METATAVCKDRLVALKLSNDSRQDLPSFAWFLFSNLYSSLNFSERKLSF